MLKLTINLANRKISSIPYRRVMFNDGEDHLVLEADLDRKKQYNIVTRICSASDLFIFAQCCEILNHHMVRYDVYITYLMGMRMDRIISWNESFSLHVVAGIINSVCKASHIYITEPHSDVSTELLNATPILNVLAPKVDDSTLVIFPDAGAAERYGDFYKYSDIVYGSKERDLSTGAIINYRINDPDLLARYSKAVVVDDLCDGGRTFVELSKIIHNVRPGMFVDIYITHAVNEHGLEKLSSCYDNVYITNSFSDVSDFKNVHVKDIVSNITNLI